MTPHLHYCLLCWGSIIKENDLLHLINASKNIVLSTIRNSNYIAHLPTIKHKYPDNSIRYCLMHKLNNEVTWASTVEI